MFDRILGIRRNVAIFTLIVLYTIAPILSVLLSISIADLLGCELSEAQPHPCKCLGAEIGGLLYNMFVFGWLALITLPTGFIAMVLFLIYLRFRQRG